MPRSIAEIRRANGGLDNLTDEDILQETFQDYASYYKSIDDYAKAVGYGGAGRGLAGSRVSAGVDSYQSNLYGLGGAVARKAGLDGVAGWMDQGRDRNEQAAQYAQQRARDLGGVEDWREVDGVGSGLNYLGGLAAQSLPYVGEAVAGGLTGGLALTGTAARMGLGAAARGAARSAGAVAASYPSAVGDILANQREAGGEDLGMAALGGVPYAALNAVGVEGLVARGLRPLAAGEGRLARMATGGVSTALGEGLGETGQELANQYFGRMAVDPNETLFNDEANKRYLDSFVGGAALGGVLGGAGGIRRPRTVDQGAFDLTGPNDEPPPQLGYNPLAGTPVVFPDGTVTLGSEQELQARYGLGPSAADQRIADEQQQQDTQARLADTARTLGVTPATGIDNAFDVLGGRVYGQPQVEKIVNDMAALQQQKSEDQQRIDAAILGANLVNLGGKTTIPTAQKIGNAINGKLKQLQLEGVDSVDRAAEILNDQIAGLVAAGKNEGDAKLGQIATVYEKLTGQAPPAMANAPKAEEKTNGKPSAPAPAAPESSAGGSPAPVGGVANPGSVSPVGGAVGGDAARADTPVQPAGPVATAGAQQPAPVTKPGLRRAPAPSKVDPFQVLAAAPDRKPTTEEDVQDVAAEARADLEKVFGERDTAILMDALVEGIPHAQIADKYGVSRGRVAQLAGEDATGQAEREKKFAKAEKETGMSREYLRGLMGKLASMSKAVAPQEEADTGETMVSEGVGVLGDQAQADLGAAGFSTVDTEGASTSNWKDSTSKGAKVMTRQAKAKLEGLQDALQQAEEQGDEKRVDELSKEIAAVSSEYVSLEEKAAADTQSAYELSEKARELEEKIESARDAGQDTIATKNRKLTLEEAEAEVEAMHAKVMEMFEKVAAALEKGKAKKSEAKKPEVKKAAPKKVVKPAEATVATTPKQDSGQTLWDGLRKTSPDLVAYEDLTDNERGYLTELADRTGGKPKLKDELGLQELMGRTAPDSAADEEQFEREMRAAAGSKQSAPDDVKTTALRFVPYQTALAIARRAVDSGVPTNWVQFHTRLDLTNESATRLVAAIQAEQAGQGEGRTYESRTGTVQFKSSVGPAYNAKPEQLIDLVDNPGVAQAVSLLHKQGMSHALKSVANWFTTGDAHVDWDGIFTMVNGKASIVLSRMAMMLPEKASVTVLHEVGHAIDLPGPTAVFSNAPTLGVTIQGGEVMPMRPGSVMDEVLNYYEENGDNEALSQLLQYPFDRTKHGKLTAQQVRAEVFAQLWAFSNLQGGMQVLRDNLPATAVFMEKVHAKVKATQYTEAGSSQGSQSGQVRDRAEAGQDAYASRSAATPRIAKKEVDLLTRTLRTGADAALNAIVFSEDLFKRASKMGLTAAMEMDRIYRERAALTGNIEREVTRIENLFNRIPESAKGTGPKSANQFLYDSTRENKWGFRPTWRGADGSKVKVDPELAKRYNALPKEAREWISAVLQHGDKMLKTKKDTLIASTNSEYDALIADAKQRNETNKVTRLEADKAASLRQFQRLFATTEFNPYAPMRRFGDFVVIAKSKEYLAAAPSERAKMESDPDHYHVSFAESRASAVELERQLKDQGSFAEVNARTKEDARGDMYGGLMDAFNKLRGNIDSELNNATEPKEIAALRAARQTVAELYLQSLAENSARKSEMRRRGVAGEIDMLRSFSTQGRADAHFLASAKFNPQAQQAVVKMRQQVKEGGSQLEKSDAFKEIMARHTQSMRYEQGGWFDVASNASRVTSLWMLATSPMYYLQNMTQPFVLSLPFMAGKHAYADASGQLMRSYFQLGDLLKSAKLGEGFDFTKVSADKAEQDMILKLVDRGRIDIGMDTELGKVKLEGDSVVSKAANRADQLLRSLSQKVEAVNRVSTALAAYRLEIKAGRTPAQALEYADEVISQTHGDYTRINAPRAFNNPMGKVALQFRKFQLIQLTLLTKLVYNSFKGGTPAEKAAARRVLAFTLGHTGVLAGVVGMPGFAAAAFIINKLADAFGDDDDEPYNLENELRKMLGGGDVARMVMRGAPTLVGTDLSGKLGMGNALSILPYTDFEASREGFNAIATGLTLGATGGLGAKVFEGLGQIKDGDYYRGLLNLAPSGVAGAIKATMEASQGETNKRGDVLVSADEIAHWETFAKVIGWPTAAQSERRFDRQVAYDNKEAFENKASKLKNEYTKAVRGNDADSRRQIIEKWQKLQQSRREAGFQAQPLSALIKAPQEQAKRERNTTGGVQFDKRNRQFVQEQTAN